MRVVQHQLLGLLSEREMAELKAELVFAPFEPLNALPALRTLSLQGCPVGARHGRAAVLSAVPQVRMLDGMPNAEAERRERESR